jgi:tRNA A37 threonylcarbamoyladenosine biosynthesis protein TsaE
MRWLGCRAASVQCKFLTSAGRAHLDTMEAILLIGIQGAGKSTFCREHFYDTHVRISLDKGCHAVW